MPWDSPRDPDRIAPVLEELRHVWEQHPDLRLGQLVVNAARAEGLDPFNIEEDRLLNALRQMQQPPPTEMREPRKGQQ